MRTFSRPSRRFGTAALVVACVMAVPGCHQYRTSVVNLTPATDSSYTVWPLAWGLAGKAINRRVDCRGQGLSEVTARSNFGFTLLTIVTLGFVAPKKIEWRCAPPNPSDGPLEPPERR